MKKQSVKAERLTALKSGAVTPCKLWVLCPSLYFHSFFETIIISVPDYLLFYAKTNRTVIDLTKKTKWSEGADKFW